MLGRGEPCCAFSSYPRPFLPPHLHSTAGRAIRRFFSLRPGNRKKDRRVPFRAGPPPFFSEQGMGQGSFAFFFFFFFKNMFCAGPDLFVSLSNRWRLLSLKKKMGLVPVPPPLFQSPKQGVFSLLFFFSCNRRGWPVTGDRVCTAFIFHGPLLFLLSSFAIQTEVSKFPFFFFFFLSMVFGRFAELFLSSLFVFLLFTRKAIRKTALVSPSSEKSVQNKGLLLRLLSLFTLFVSPGTGQSPLFFFFFSREKQTVFPASLVFPFFHPSPSGIKFLLFPHANRLVFIRARLSSGYLHEPGSGKNFLFSPPFRLVQVSLVLSLCLRISFFFFPGFEAWRVRIRTIFFLFAARLRRRARGEREAVSLFPPFFFFVSYGAAVILNGIRTRPPFFFLPFPAGIPRA